MRTIQTNVYKYDELSDDAKERARDWFRQGNADDTFWSESVIDDFADVAKACGFTLSKMRGSNGLAIYWSGFWSQGDGASFEGSWRASDVDITAMLADRPVTYKDADGKEQTCKGNKELAKILNGFKELADVEPTAYGSVSASHRGHNLTCEYATEHDDEYGAEETCAAGFKELCNDLARYLYRALETEYEYQNSNECVEDAIVANEYEFTVDGEPA